MELGAHVWLRSDASHWGWVPAMITKKEEGTLGGVKVIYLTLNDDTTSLDSNLSTSLFSSKENLDVLHTPTKGHERQYFSRSRSSDHYADVDPFEVVLTVDPEALKSADHDDIKLRNLPRSFQLSGEDPEAGVITSPSTHQDDDIVGGVNDLIGLTHLHEPAILHALRLRYDADIIYTSTGPILIAVNPFKRMELYSQDTMEEYRIQGENGADSASPGSSGPITPFNRRKLGLRASVRSQRLPPHAYQTADDAYRAMMRGIENTVLMGGAGRGISNNPRSLRRGGGRGDNSRYDTPTNQSILVSGESGAGKTVTTKIVLNYFAMLSKKKAECDPYGQHGLNESAYSDEEVSIEQQVLQSNPILESFGNARTIRNDNSSRFGKYIDIRFTPSGSLSGANIETYLLEKVRLIHPSLGERNYHVFYQFLASATATEREQFFFGNMGFRDFKLLNQTGTYDRRDGISDENNHQEMLDAMITIGFDPTTIQSLMRLVVAILFAGNMTFTQRVHNHNEYCTLDETNASLAAASLLGVSFENLSAALTTRVILAGNETVHKSLSIDQATKSCEALISALYGATFDFIVEKVNDSIVNDDIVDGGIATIGVLDIFGFETFDVNNFEQLCINYTNEALQQQFNKYVFKLEQQEYEREGILWKFISFPDNQDVLDLIDKKKVGIISLLDDQCKTPATTDKTFSTSLYSNCKTHPRFEASFRQVGLMKFGIKHYAGPVEYTIEGFMEKNKDELPRDTVNLLLASDKSFVNTLGHIMTEDSSSPSSSGGNSSGRKIRSHSPVPSAPIRPTVGGQFASQLRSLREKIDTTAPHYVRCLKPNENLVPDDFDPAMIADQLRSAGVLEAVRVSRVGFPQRYTHLQFVKRYGCLAPNATKTRSVRDVKKQCLGVVEKVATQIWKDENPSLPKGSGKLVVDPGDVGIQVGKTKVFLRQHAFEYLERYRSREIERNVIRIQAIARGYIHHREYRHALRALWRIQCMVRRMIGAKIVRGLREERAATRIQTVWRRYDARHAFLATVTITSWCQRIWRGRNGRLLYQSLDEERRSIVIQKYWRRFTCYKHFNRQKYAVLVLQCFVRCCTARQELKKLKMGAKDLETVKKELERVKAELAAAKLAQGTTETLSPEENDKIEAERRALEEKVKQAQEEARQAKEEAMQAKEEASQAKEEARQAQEELEKVQKGVAEEAEKSQTELERLQNEIEETKRKHAQELELLATCPSPQSLVKITDDENTVTVSEDEAKLLDEVKIIKEEKEETQAEALALKQELEEARLTFEEEIRDARGESETLRQRLEEMEHSKSSTEAVNATDMEAGLQIFKDEIERLNRELNEKEAEREKLEEILIEITESMEDEDDDDDDSSEYSSSDESNEQPDISASQKQSDINGSQKQSDINESQKRSDINESQKQSYLNESQKQSDTAALPGPSTARRSKSIRFDSSTNKSIGSTTRGSTTRGSIVGFSELKKQVEGLRSEVRHKHNYSAEMLMLAEDNRRNMEEMMLLREELKELRMERNKR
mmetsp:Transcript_41931/g.61332  ORF Transcript_41931/g.61332 Transcript_41931/m.61332 type:complete len:1524 (+) Transcript_41931:174-4745(+)